MNADNTSVAEEVRLYVQGLIDVASQERAPELFKERHLDTIYHLEERNGVSVTVLRTTSLREEQLTKLLRYRLAQYLAVGFVDPNWVYSMHMKQEPLSFIAPGDIHYIAGSAETGEILCYASLRTLSDVPEGATLQTKERPWLPVEETFGWGIFNRLRILPDLPLQRVWELKRFVKNHKLPLFDALGTRAPIEIGLALAKTLTGTLNTEVDAFVGDFEEDVARRNLEFFHLPMVVIHGAMPYVSSSDYLLPRFQESECYPFAALVSDMTSLVRLRVPEVERALELPGKQGILALFALKRDIPEFKSNLEPPGGLSALSEATVPQKGVSMEARRQMLFRGDIIREFNPFAGMSVAEAATLGSFMERVDAAQEDVVVRQGEEGDAIYLIEAGHADVNVKGKDEKSITVSTLGPGDYFGEIGLLTGGARIASVIAITPMKLLKLTRDTYMQYLKELADVERDIAQTAAIRAADTFRKTTQ